MKVLWAQRTTKKRATDESPFALVFGTEAVLPTKAGLPTLTTMVAENLEENQCQRTRNLDLLEEVRERAQIRRVAYQQKARAFYDQKEKNMKICEGRMSDAKDSQSSLERKIWRTIGRTLRSEISSWKGNVLVNQYAE